MSRVGAIPVWVITLAGLTGCHPTPPVPGEPAPAERVEVGYGEQSKEHTGGAVQSATGDELSNVKVTRVEELLEGRFAGVHVIRTPGGLSIRIRGVSTFLGDKGPLYVIDGMPVEVDARRGLDWLSPSEIERIDVLKDPTETTMYGVRGANGVILITTKRPH